MFEQLNSTFPHGLSTTVADARFAKPLDQDLISRLANEHEVFITVEEGSIGGFGSHVAQALADSGQLDNGALRFRSVFMEDNYTNQMSPDAMYTNSGLDSRGIVAKVFEALGKEMSDEVKLGA